jgi:hypothetical protein
MYVSVYPPCFLDACCCLPPAWCGVLLVWRVLCDCSDGKFVPQIKAAPFACASLLVHLSTPIPIPPAGAVFVLSLKPRKSVCDRNHCFPLFSFVFTTFCLFFVCLFFKVDFAQRGHIKYLSRYSVTIS